MPASFRHYLVLLAVASLPLVAPAQSSFTSPQPKLPTLIFEASGTKITAEIASVPEELERGLMFREKLADNDGMLFVLTQIGRANFWMMNTSLPLSVAYLDVNGAILEIHDMQPFDRTLVSSTSDQVAFALEMNQGWFSLNKIKPGNHLNPTGVTWVKLNQMRHSS